MKYRPETVEKVLQHLRSGMNREDSCILSGIGRETFYSWIREKPDFQDKVLLAEKECKQRNVVRVQNASRRDWRAAAWYLKHKHRDEYFDRQQNDVAGVPGRPLQAVVTTVTIRPEALKAMDDKALDALVRLGERQRDHGAGPKPG